NTHSLLFPSTMNTSFLFALLGVGAVVSQNCVDLVNPRTGVSECASRRNLCNNSAYYALMTTQCPRTCGRCGSTTSTTARPGCVDLKNPSTGVSECAQNARLCNNPAYYSFMTTQCPKTCGRCGSGRR
ncbi:hypothetical protein PFISCL1PPCAC_28516, partial [Pristionchus fissidentatus]